MWYVVQVRTGTEESIRIQCQKWLLEQAIYRKTPTKDEESPYNMEETPE